MRQKESSMSMKTIVTTMMAGGTAVVMMSLWAATVSAAAPEFVLQTPQEPHHAATDAAKPPSGMEAMCQTMMAERDTLMTDMKAADQRLDGLVAAMNTASGMERMAATANVVTEMVTQRRTMRDARMKMQDGMMSHMMEHMQAGTASMAMCPMMKQMGGMEP
jgi:hypothetical protein